MRKIVLTFGLIAGAVLSVMMAVTLPFQDFDRGAIIGYATMIAAFLMVFFGVRSYRDNVSGGTVSFGRAFTVGLLITIIASACYVATWEVIFYKITPDFTDKYAAYTVEKAKKSGATDAQVAATAKQMADFKEMYKKPLVNIALTFLEPLPVGLLFTLVTAGVMSRKRRVAGAALTGLALTASLSAFTGASVDDAKAIQGKWASTNAVVGGRRLPDAVLKTISMTLDDGKYTVLVGNAPDNGTYTIDATAKPKSITVIGTEGVNVGKTFPAIYELDGDTLRICYDLSGAKRPTELSSTVGTQLYLVTYVRVRE